MSKKSSLTKSHTNSVQSVYERILTKVDALEWELKNSEERLAEMTDLELRLGTLEDKLDTLIVKVNHIEGGKHGNT